MILGEQQYFCLGRRFSKHKMTRDMLKIWETWPLGSHPGFAYGWVPLAITVKQPSLRLAQLMMVVILLTREADLKIKFLMLPCESATLFPRDVNQS